MASLAHLFVYPLLCYAVMTQSTPIFQGWTRQLFEIFVSPTGTELCISLRRNGRHCFSAWNHVLLSLGPLKEGLWDLRIQPFHKAESSVNSVIGILSNISWSASMCVLLEVYTGGDIYLLHLQKGKLCLGLLGSDNTAAQQRKFFTHKFTVPCFAWVFVSSTQYANISLGPAMCQAPCSAQDTIVTRLVSDPQRAPSLK